MNEKESLTETIARALFDSVGHYHSELTWEQASPEHRGFVMKQAEAVRDAVEAYQLQQRQ